VSVDSGFGVSRDLVGPKRGSSHSGGRERQEAGASDLEKGAMRFIGRLVRPKRRIVTATRRVAIEKASIRDGGHIAKLNS
jgi:hypothetical protein